MPAPMNYYLEKTSRGTDLVVTSDWNQRAAQALEAGEANGLTLNYARGFRERDLGFIEGLPIKRLTVLARTHNELTPIYSLSATLESLDLTTGPAKIDLTRLPNLTSLSAEWSQIADTIGTLPMLRSLFVLSYTEPNLDALSRNSELRSIRMKDRPRIATLDGIEAFPWLTQVQFPLAPIDDLSPLEQASPLLEDVDFESCRSIDVLAPLRALPGLRRINFGDCGDLDSVAFLRATPLVDTVLMWGTRLRDHDLSALHDLAELRLLRMQDRKEYSPRVTEISSAKGLH